MAYVTSANTTAEIKAAYEDAAIYDVTNNETACREFIVAARLLISRLLVNVRQGDHELEAQLNQIRNEATAAQKWLGDHGTGDADGVSGTIQFVGMEEFRD